jgi:hypothetical protein
MRTISCPETSETNYRYSSCSNTKGAVLNYTMTLDSVYVCSPVYYVCKYAWRTYTTCKPLCKYVCIYIYVVSMYIWYTCIRMLVFVRMYVCTYVCRYTWCIYVKSVASMYDVCACMYTGMCACMYVVLKTLLFKELHTLCNVPKNLCRAGNHLPADWEDLGCLNNLAYSPLSKPQILLWFLLIVEPLKFSSYYSYHNVSPCENPQSWHSVPSCDLHGSQKTSICFSRYQLTVGFYTK